MISQSRAGGPRCSLVFCDYAPLVLVTWQSHKPPTGAGTKCECGQNYGLYQDTGHRLAASLSIVYLCYGTLRQLCQERRKMFAVMFPVYAHVAERCCTLYNGRATRALIKQERRNLAQKWK